MVENDVTPADTPAVFVLLGIIFLVKVLRRLRKWDNINKLHRKIVKLTSRQRPLKHTFVYSFSQCLA